MFAIKCMVLVFTIISIFEIIPTENPSRDAKVDSNLFISGKFSIDYSLRSFLSAILISLFIGIIMLSIEETLIYPVMCISIAISLFGWVISIMNRQDITIEDLIHDRNKEIE